MNNLTLSNFKRSISGVIARRGKDYYLDSFVTALSEFEPGDWGAEVEGSGNNEYAVLVSIDDHENITDYNCNCPAGKKRICKHVVAVLYEIRDEFKKERPPSHLRGQALIRQVIQN